jgi:hypothetical protein
MSFSCGKDGGVEAAEAAFAVLAAPIAVIVIAKTSVLHIFRIFNFAALPSHSCYG